jgi:hypothetical protein
MPTRLCQASSLSALQFRLHSSLDPRACGDFIPGRIRPLSGSLMIPRGGVIWNFTAVGDHAGSGSSSAHKLVYIMRL